MPEPAIRNASLSADAQEVILRINRKLKGFDQRTQVKIRGPLIAYLQEYAKGEGIRPSASRAREFCSVFETCNRAVAIRWFGREALFDADFSDEPEEQQAVSANKVANILTDFICRAQGQSN